MFACGPVFLVARKRITGSSLFFTPKFVLDACRPLRLPAQTYLSLLEEHLVTSAAYLFIAVMATTAQPQTTPKGPEAMAAPTGPAHPPAVSQGRPGRQDPADRDAAQSESTKPDRQSRRRVRAGHAGQCGIEGFPQT